MSASAERWNELEAILLLQQAGRLVDGLEATGAKMPQAERKLYHARLVAAHDTKDMAAYQTSLKEYVQGAREAYRKTKGGQKGEKG
jgi:hypothetical protein